MGRPSERTAQASTVSSILQLHFPFPPFPNLPCWESLVSSSFHSFDGETEKDSERDRLRARARQAHSYPIISNPSTLLSFLSLWHQSLSPSLFLPLRLLLQAPVISMLFLFTHKKCFLSISAEHALTFLFLLFKLYYSEKVKSSELSMLIA